MARPRQPLELRDEVRAQLQVIAASRIERAGRVQRAQVLLAYADGVSIVEIEESLRISRPTIYNTVNKAREFGAISALDDLRGGRGRPRLITEEARAWLVSLACQQPKTLGYPHELWTRALLAKHIRETCVEAGHSCLSEVSPGTVTKILNKNKLKPHKVKYYLEKRDPEFESKMAQVLHVYREVRLVREFGLNAMTAFLSFDEKPGIQALGRKGEDLPPVPGKHPEIARDYEYVRYGTLTLMAGLDLLTGHVAGRVVERHRSKEFTEFLKAVDERYPSNWTITIILDNHSAHTSRETRRYLASKHGRFEFVFTPKHGSWLNLAESLFAKLTNSILRGMRVASKEELRQRLESAVEWFNDNPTVFRWNYHLDEAIV